MKQSFVFIFIAFFMLTFTLHGSLSAQTPFKRGGAKPLKKESNVVVKKNAQNSQTNQSSLSEESDTSQTIIEILNADRLKAINSDSLDQKKLIGNVQLKQENTLFECDSAYLYESENVINAFGSIHIQEGDSIDIYADYLKYDGSTKIARLFQNVRLEDQSNTITSDTLYYYINQDRAILYDNVHITDDKIDIYSDSLDYFSKTEKAFLSNNVQLIDEDMTLEADDMNYDFKADIGTYEGNGKMQNKETTLTSQKGWYNHNTKDVRFEEDVYVKGEKYEIETDELLYNTRTEFAEFEGNTIIINEGNTIECTSGTYDKKKDLISVSGETVLNNDGQTLAADSLYFEKESGKGFAFGNVMWIDTTQNMSVDCNYMEYEEETSYILATGDLLFKQTIDDDTLYLVADTLLSVKMTEHTDTINTNTDSTMIGPVINPGMDSSLVDIPQDSLDSLDVMQESNKPKVADNVLNETAKLGNENKDSNTVFTAYRNVRFFKSDFQGIADSMSYDTSDSTFQFFKDPLVWFDQTQLTADMVFLETQNNKPSSFLLEGNGVIGTEDRPGIYNQLKGDTIRGLFVDGKMNKILVRENSESIYYAKNENEEYYGVNESTCKDINILFVDEEITKIKFFENPKSSFNPIRSKDPYSYRLSGFNWEDKKRPNNWEDLLAQNDAAIVDKDKLDSLDDAANTENEANETNSADSEQQQDKKDAGDVEKLPSKETQTNKGTNTIDSDKKTKGVQGRGKKNE